MVGTPEFVPRVAARMVSINDEPVTGRARFTTTVMWEAERPEYVARDGRLLVEEGIACGQRGGGGFGQRGNRKTARHASRATGSKCNRAAGRFRRRWWRSIEWEQRRFMPTSSFVFNPPALAGLPVAFDGGVRIMPTLVRAIPARGV